MYRKKLMQACLAGALVATIGTSANVPVVKAAAETQTVSETDDAEDVEESEEVEDTEEEEAVEETSEDEEVETEEVETYSAGDAGEENSPEENKSVIVKYQFVCDGKFVAGGDCFVPSGIQNYSVFEEYLPEGYTRVTGGDTTITEGETYVIRVEKIDSGDTEEPEKTEVTMNIQFKDGMK